MGEPKQDSWFPAKRYGWGWGLPITWQGWVVLLVYVLLFGLGVFAIDVRTHTLGFLVYVVALTAALIAVCWAKGEPPRWRWGGK